MIVDYFPPFGGRESRTQTCHVEVGAPCGLKNQDSEPMICGLSLSRHLGKAPNG